MEITVQEIRDFCFCSLYYKYKYLDKLPFKPSIPEQFEDQLHTVLYNFYFHIQDKGKAPSLRYLKHRWHVLWDRRLTKEDIIQSTTTVADNGNDSTTRRRYYKQGLRLIDSFYDNYGSSPGVPIMVGKEYDIEFGKHRLKGTIELVRDIAIKRKPLLEIVDFRVSTKDVHLYNDIELTAASYAFRVLFGVDEERMVYHGLRTHQRIPIKRGIEDYKSLLKLVNNIDKALRAKIYIPAMGQRCITCPYYPICLKGMIL